MYYRDLTRTQRKLFSQWWKVNKAKIQKLKLKQHHVIPAWKDGIIVGKLISERKAKRKLK